MATSFLNWRIISALVIGAVIVIGAIAYTRHLSLSIAADRAQASETDALLKSVASRDTDGDGLPDWQEELYGTDPSNAHSVDANLTDAEAVSEGLVKPKFTVADTAGLASAGVNASSTVQAIIPGTNPAPGSLTDEFAHVFFEQYIQTGNGAPLDEAGQQQLITSLLKAFTQNAQNLVTSHYTAAAIHVDDAVTTLVYAKGVEDVLVAHDLAAGEADPFALLTAALQNGDPTAFKKLNTLANVYAAIATDLSRVPVPGALSDTHLSLIKSFDVMAQSTALAANLNNDPLATLAGLSIYATAPKEMASDFETLQTAIVSAEGTPTKGQTGYLLWVLGQQAQGL